MKVEITWKITHYSTDQGYVVSISQLVDGCGDCGFVCLVKDYQDFVTKMTGVGQLSLKLSNFIYDYIKINKLR